jgi:hypothetical protein
MFTAAVSLHYGFGPSLDLARYRPNAPVDRSIPALISLGLAIAIVFIGERKADGY